MQPLPFLGRRVLHRPDDGGRPTARRRPAQPVQELEAVHLRHEQVEDNGGRPLGVSQFEAAMRIRRAERAQAQLPQKALGQLQRRRVVVDNEH